MKTKALLRTAFFVATAFLLTSCIFDSLLKPEEQVKDTERIVTVTATMPNYSPSTRIGLKPGHGSNQLGVDFFWEEKDVVDILVIGKLKDIEVARRMEKNIRVKIAGDHTAFFEFKLPSGKYDIIDVYGVYGGKGFSEEKGKEHMVILPHPKLSTDCDIGEIARKKGFVLTFAEKDIKLVEHPLHIHITAQFKHLGSLFRVLLINKGSHTLGKVESVAFVAPHGEPLPVHRPDEDKSMYNIINEAFDHTLVDEGALTFPTGKIGQVHLEPAKPLEFWGWYIPDTHGWPVFRLNLYAEDGNVKFESKYTEVSKTPETGKVYHFGAIFDSDTQTLIFPEQSIL